MAEIIVLRPDEAPSPLAEVILAARRPLPQRPVIGLIANGKPAAPRLLVCLADEIATRLRRPVDVELIDKSSAIVAVEDRDAVRMAARAHLVITGVGD
jgi:hypothetical protein